MLQPWMIAMRVIKLTHRTVNLDGEDVWFSTGVTSEKFDGDKVVPLEDVLDLLVEIHSEPSIGRMKELIENTVHNNGGVI